VADRLSLLYREISLEQVRAHFDYITKTPHDPVALADLLPVKAIQKFDGFLADDLLNNANGQRLLDIGGTVKLAVEILDSFQQLRASDM
jgi:hypothetical protein